MNRPHYLCFGAVLALGCNENLLVGDVDTDGRTRGSESTAGMGSGEGTGSGEGSAGSGSSAGPSEGDSSDTEFTGTSSAESSGGTGAGDSNVSTDSGADDSESGTADSTGGEDSGSSDAGSGGSSTSGSSTGGSSSGGSSTGGSSSSDGDTGAASPCDTAGCDADATCDDGTGEAVCTCNPGFSGDGLTCAPTTCVEDASVCDPNADCVTGGPAPVCVCRSEFTGDGAWCVATKTVFVTAVASRPGSGLIGLDNYCQAEADGAGIGVTEGKTYRAWLSDSTTEPRSRFLRSMGAYHLAGGGLVANDWYDLTDGTLETGINVSASGALQAGVARLTTNARGTRSTTNDCANWFGDTSGTSQGTRTIDGGTTWEQSGDVSCGSSVRTYCVESGCAVGSVKQGQWCVRELADLWYDDFSTEAPSWTTVDEGTINAPSVWSVSGGFMRQTSNIHGPGAGAPSLRAGTFRIHDDMDAALWTDYTVAVRLRSVSDQDDGIGLMVRYQDASNYYKFDMDDELGFRKLFKVVGGVETELAVSNEGYTKEDEHEVRIQLEADEITVWVDGVDVFGGPVVDASLTFGTVALFSWRNVGAIFDEIAAWSRNPFVSG